MTESFLTYLEFEKRYSAHTVTNYRIDLGQLTDFLESVYEINEVTSVNYQQLRSFVLQLKDDNYENKSVNRKIACLKSYFKFLMKSGEITSNPAHRLQSLKTSKDLPTFIPEKEILEGLDEIEFENNFSGTRDKLILNLLYSTGMRVSELTELKLAGVQLAERLIKVTGKGNKQRIIPLIEPIVQELNLYLILRKSEFEANISDYVIVTNKGKQTYSVFVYRTVREYLDKITRVTKRSPHVLRHTFATHLLDKGADLNAIKELLGHSSLASTQVYTSSSLEKLKETFRKAHPKA